MKINIKEYGIDLEPESHVEAEYIVNKFSRGVCGLCWHGEGKMSVVLRLEERPRECTLIQTSGLSERKTSKTGKLQKKEKKTHV